MAKSFEEISQNHPCFGNGRATVGRIHLPVCPGCNIACRFCERSLNDTENRPGVTAHVLKPAETIPLIKKALEISPGVEKVIDLEKLRRYRDSIRKALSQLEDI